MKQYDLHQLQTYLRHRLDGGAPDEQYESRIAKDDFLQTVAGELETQLRESPGLDIARVLEKRAGARWPQLARAVAVGRPQAHPGSFLRYPWRRAWRELQSGQFQYYLAFNCCCILAILCLSWWFYQTGDGPGELLSTLEAGFKP